MDAGIIKLVGLLLFLAGVFYLVYNLIPRRRPGDIINDEKEFQVSEESRFVLMFKPFYQTLTPLIKKLPIPEYRNRMRRYIITAGLEGQIDDNDMAGFQITFMLLVGFGCLLVFRSYVVISLAFFLGLLSPYLWLYEKKKQRQENIRISMPDIVDMLSLSVEAGLAFNTSVLKVCDIFREDKDPFVVELYLMDQNIKLGRSREEALKIMAERVDIMELDSFVSTLIQAEKMGSSIASALKSQAERMRSERFMKAEKIGAQASQKLLIPMMIFIFPIIFIIIFGPYLIKFFVN
ncbi:MAG TPA: type II secretion system F family protein [Desulfobacteraceae bacterium]|nr:type II secretion system F family protein [Desulfobacteraceae bacterium]HPJ68865.1 type II secretion system F family protein [Desulfobacteraceae bacterium]HPQ29929.1 type II secretion system F family protein [Desulfobacteraceae bacterium]